MVVASLAALHGEARQFLDSENGAASNPPQKVRSDRLSAAGSSLTAAIRSSRSCGMPVVSGVEECVGERECGRE